MPPSLQSELREFIELNFLIGDENLSNDDSFLERGIIDSTGILELVSFIEETYEIELGAEDLVPENLDSVTRLAHFIGRKLDANLAASGGAGL